MPYVFTDEAKPSQRGYVFDDEMPQSPPPEKKQGLWNTIVGTAEQVAAGVNSGANALHRKMFGKESQAFKGNAEWWRNKARANGIDSNSVYGKVAEGVGQVPAALPEWLPTPAGVAVGTALNASEGYQDAAAQGENPVWGGIKGAAKHLLFRGAFKVIDAVPVAKMLPKTLPQATKTIADVGAKATAMGGIMAGETALEGGEANDITAAAILGAGLPIASHALHGGSLKETLKEQGIPDEVATHLEKKAEEIDKSDPRNLDVFTDEVNNIIDLNRQAEAVQEPEPKVEAATQEEPIVEPKTAPEDVPFPAEEPVPGFHDTSEPMPQEESGTSLRQGTPEPDLTEFKQQHYQLSPEERTNLRESIKQALGEEGQFFNPDDVDSLINLKRLDPNDPQSLSLVFEAGHSMKDRVKERLGEDTGKHDEIVRNTQEAIIRKLAKDTTLSPNDILKQADKNTLDLERIMYDMLTLRSQLLKYADMAKSAAEYAKAHPEDVEAQLYADHLTDMLSQHVANDAAVARLNSWMMNSRKIAPDSSMTVDIPEMSLADFKANKGLVDLVAKEVERKGGLEESKKFIDEYLKADDLQKRLEKVKLKDKSSIWNTIFEGSSFNMLSSIYGRAKDLFHNVVRPLTDDLEHLGAAIGSLGKGVSFREAGYRFLGDYKGTMEALTKSWEAAKEISVPELKEAFRSPVDMLYQTIENFESFIDSRGFLHGRTKAHLEGLGKKYVSKAYIETTGTGKVFSAILDGIGKMTHTGDTLKDFTYNLIDLHGMLGRSLVFGAMKFTDLPSEYMGYNAQAYGLAARETVKQGLKGDEAAKAIETIVTLAKAHRDEVQVPKDFGKEYRVVAKQIHEESMKYSLERTLKQEFESKYAKEIEGFVNHTSAGKAIKVLAGQYFSTPVRLLKYELDRNPLTFLLSKNMRESVYGMRGKEAQSLATAKIMFGTLAQATAAYLISNGSITLLSPVSDRKSWRDAGVLEVALNINGRLYKLSALEPFGNFLSSMAAYYSGYSQAKNEGGFVPYSVMMAWINDRTQRSYMKSLFDLKSIADGDGEALQRFMMGQGAKLIPYSGLVSSVTDMFGDGEVRAVDNPANLLAKVYNPNTLDIVPDQYGKPRVTTDRFLGVPTSVPAKDFTARSEAVRLGVSLPNAPKVLPLTLSNFTKYGFPMSPLDQRNYMRSLANAPINMEERMQKVIDTPEYRKAPQREQQRILQKIVSESHNLAKELQYKRPEVVQAAKEQGVAVKEWYGSSGPIPTHENWYEFLNSGKLNQRTIMNKHGLNASE